MPSPTLPALDSSWRDMESSIYAVLSGKPIEYLFLLEDGRYATSPSPTLCLYSSVLDPSSLTLSESPVPLAWRFLP